MTTSPAAFRLRILKVLIAIALAAFALTYCYINTRSTQLTVLVRDAETGAWLADALVEVQNSNGQTLYELKTDENGMAGVKRLDPVRGYRVLVRHVDYVPALGTDLEVRLHKTTEVRVPLRPLPGGRVYVGMDGNRIAVIDTASFLLVTVGEGPADLRDWPIGHLAAHPEGLYIAARSRSYLLDAAELDELQGWTLSGTVEGLAATQEGARLLMHLAGRSPDRLVIATAGSEGMRSAEIAPLPESAQDAAQALSDKRLHVVGGLLVAEGADGEALAYAISDLVRLASGVHDVTWATLSPDQRLLYVGNPAFGGLAVLRPDSPGEVQLVELGEGLSACAVSPDGRELYLTNAALGTLLVLDAQTLERVAVVPVGRAPGLVAADAAGERVYVANLGSWSITVVDAAGRQVIETILIGGEPAALLVR